MSNTETLPGTGSTRLYRAIWRWHFYAGLLVVPFLLVLAVTGLIMVYGNSIETFLGPRYTVTAAAHPASLAEQASAAAASIEGGAASMLVIPSTPEQATRVIVDNEAGSYVVNVDPDGAKVLGSYLRDATVYSWANNIHGTLLIGDIGDRLLEVAAGLGVVLVLTGIYMWWPRGTRSLKAALLPTLGKGRAFWRNLHQTTGFYFAAVLLFFLISGLSWTGVWGSQYVQAWSTFPAAKWDNVPLSDETHASMNHGVLEEVPWALEQTPMPESGSQAGITGLPEGTPVNADSIAALGRSIGFDGQFRINLPADATGVYTLSADSMDGDTANPMGDRTVHVDQYTGKILAEVGFADYSPAGKAMAVGIALHQGNIGWWNTLLNLLFCMAVILMTVSGVIMWWMRRPKDAVVGAPRYVRGYRAPIGILVIALAVCAVFPLTGIAVVLFALIDTLLPARFKQAGA